MPPFLFCLIAFVCQITRDPHTMPNRMHLPHLGNVWLKNPVFDHVLRSEDSYSLKWDYVRNNPVRAGLVACANEWPYLGECGMLTY